MRPARDVSLLPDSNSDLMFISEVVNVLAIADFAQPWTEVVSEFADQWNYLSISIDTRPGYQVPCLAIEFGVQSPSKRRARGCLLAQWSVGACAIEGLEVVLLDGIPVDVTEFASCLASYLDLPQVHRNSVSSDID